MGRKLLTDKGVAALKPRDKLYAHPDPQCQGHYVRVSPTGGKTFLVVARDPNGKQKWVSLGNAAHINIEQARKKAREILTRVKGGQRVEGPQSFESVTKEWLKRYVEAQGLITAPAIRRVLNNHVLPSWGGRDFKSITRKDVADLLDQIEDKAGPVAADKTLAYLSGLFNWAVARNGDFLSPIVKGMKRTKSKDRARERILTDDEIRTIWKSANGVFGDLVKMLLLTGQRREKVAAMRWDEVSVDGTWSVKNGDKREKGSGGDLVLPPMALDIIRGRPRLGNNPYVFAGRADTHFSGYSKSKAALDKATGITGWTLHDCRRTARSLMSRAGVRPDIAERVLGHVQQGVLGTYDRHSYREEKAQALKMLAGLIANILRGDGEKVRVLRG
jgi:integrase